MNIFTCLRSSTIVLCSLFFTPIQAQEEKDYFITVWDLSLDKEKNTRIEFWSLTTGEVHYTWETIPAGESGNGKISGNNSKISISNLPVNKTIKLKLAPQNLNRFYYDEGYYDSKLTQVSQWGTVAWSSMEKAFYNRKNLNIQAIDLPNLTKVKTMEMMFYYCPKLNGPVNINQWNTENVNIMQSMFGASTIFNQPIHNWNTQNVTDMSQMFSAAEAFNQDLSSWNTQNVTDMKEMFYRAKSFNQALSSWNTQNVTDMGYMFTGAISFNQTLSSWNTENVTDMSAMFFNAYSFNQPINTWNTQRVTDMGSMFHGATAFNQPLSSWNTHNVSDMGYMFFEAETFNQPLISWNTQNVKRMGAMFGGAKSFNQALSSWDTKNVTDMSFMFSNAISFNQPLTTWNTQNVTYMSAMFNKATNFNNSLASFNLFSIGSFSSKLDPYMLDSCGIDCKNYSYTLIGWANNPNTPTNKKFGAAGLKYSTQAQVARDILTKNVDQGGKGWTILGDALSKEDCGLITSNQEREVKSNLYLYPNPAQNNLFLKNAPSGTAYKIMDGMGREVNSGTYETDEISIVTLPTGLYSLLCGDRRFTFVKE